MQVIERSWQRKSCERTRGHQTSWRPTLGKVDMDEPKAESVITAEGKDISPETVEKDDRRDGAEMMAPAVIVVREATM